VTFALAYSIVRYNRQRLHSTLGYVSPAEYEGLAAAAAHAASYCCLSFRGRSTSARAGSPSVVASGVARSATPFRPAVDLDDLRCHVGVSWQSDTMTAVERGIQRRQIPVGDPGERPWPVQYPFLSVMFSVFLAVVAQLVLAVVIAQTAVRDVLGAVVAVAIIAGGALLAVRRISRYVRVPRFTEFDGQVIAQWHQFAHDDTEYCVAIDDGQRPTAWAFILPRDQQSVLTPGTVVHVQVNERRNKPKSIQELL
jgi:hypothetical protein